MPRRALLKYLPVMLILTGLIATTTACEELPPNTNPPVTLVTTTSVKPTTIPNTTTRPTTQTSTTTPPPTENQPNKKPVNLGIRRADMQDELALNMLLKPVDENGKVLAIEGALDIKVWEMLDAFDITQKGELIQSWDGIKITADDYDTDYGEAFIRLTYEDFFPEWWQYGVVDVELEFDEGQIEGSGGLLLGKIPGC